MEEAGNKKEHQIGTFSDDLGAGLSNVLSEETLEEARKRVALDINNITEDIEKRIYRLEPFLRKEIGAIPRTEVLVNWMFDKKKLKQTGDFFPKITDKELIGYLKEYNIFLECEARRAEHIEQKVDSFQWLGTPQQLSSLYTALIKEEFICSSTSLEVFQAIFSDSDIPTIKGKILWLKKGKNKMPSKRSISDLVDILIEKEMVKKPSVLTKALSDTFCASEGDIIFTHSNLVKNGCYSEYRTDLEKIVKNL